MERRLLAKLLGELRTNQLNVSLVCAVDQQFLIAVCDQQTIAIDSFTNIGHRS